MAKRILLIDDVRTEVAPEVQCKVDLIARTYWTGIGALRAFEKWDLLLLDHDLSSFDPNTGREYTGYDVMCFLEEHQLFLPHKIEIVSANPVGRARMRQIIDKLYPRKP